MRAPAFPQVRRAQPSRPRERGVTMVLVALAMIAIIAMAALSIDVITLYLAREEAQRSADAAALAAARVISVSGITGDPNNSATPPSWYAICGGLTSAATVAATAVATRDAVGSSVASVNVVYSAAGTSGSNSDCSTLTSAFAVNPVVTVQVSRASLPTFFSRIWGNTGTPVSATASAEALNPSNSGTLGAGNIIPVQPRCVKPWVVPNHDPLNPRPSGGTYCDSSTTNLCNKLVDQGTGQIINPGISLNGGGVTPGVIGEHFWLVPDCHYANPNCVIRINGALAPKPQANLPRVPPHTQAPPNLMYLPGQVLSASSAVPTCNGTGSNYEQAIDGCDQTTAYQCGVQSSAASNPNMIDLSENPAGSGDTANAVQCLINQGNNSNSQPTGQDTLNPYPAPTAFPFQILAGTNNPLVQTSSLPVNSLVSGSSSIVSLPIYDDSAVFINTGGSQTTEITIVGFLQVFIDSVDQYGNVEVTVLNVSGCSNGGSGPVANPVAGTSPVPIRLISSQ